MKNKPLLIGIAAAILGGLALHVYLARFELEAAGGAPRQVVTVTQDLTLGETITRSAVSLRALPEQYVEERHILADQLERVVGTRVTSQVASGSTLLWSDLDIMQSSRTLSGLVRAGMRAFTLPDRQVDFDGLLRPGDRVDLLFTATGDTSETRTLLQNVLVLTVGSNLGQDEEHEARRGSVTLSVSIEQAQLIAHSVGRGTMRLALRNPQDLVLADGIAPTRGIDSSELQANGAREARRDR
jgi:pilus assembly protein CpaB